MIDKDMEYCSNCNEWVEINVRDDGGPTPLGWRMELVGFCKTCGDATDSNGPICNRCELKTNPDEGEIVDSEMVCDECLASDEEEESK